MNRKTIQKIIDELDKETPRLDYIRGVLETLLESLPDEKLNSVPVFKNEYKHIPGQPLHNPIDESAIIENSALGVLNKIDRSAIKTE